MQVINNIDQSTYQHVLLFDGYCNLCSGAVQFVLKREKFPNIYFASLQSEYGQKAISKFGITQSIDSFIFITNDKAYIKSTAALMVTRHLKNLYPILSVFLVVPKFIRDFVYDWVAKHRYNWFGKTDSCWLPDEKYKKRFIS